MPAITAVRLLAACWRQVMPAQQVEAISAGCDLNAREQRWLMNQGRTVFSQVHPYREFRRCDSPETCSTVGRGTRLGKASCAAVEQSVLTELLRSLALGRIDQSLMPIISAACH